MAKPKVAFFDFASCEGCQLCAIDVTAEQLLDLLNVVDIVEFREAISETDTEYDVALIEGSITRDSDIERLKDIRKRSKLLVAFGACAHIGGVNALKNLQSIDAVQKDVYEDDPKKYETGKVRAIAEVVQVDAFIPGCPIDTGEFVKVVKNIVLGKKPGIPDYPVCVECKQNENVCVFEKGIFCLGPVIRAGCNARCPSNGGYCFGCRGTVSDPNINSQKDIMAKYNLSVEDIQKRFDWYLERVQNPQKKEEVMTNG